MKSSRSEKRRKKKRHRCLVKMNVLFLICHSGSCWDETTLGSPPYYFLRSLRWFFVLFPLHS